MLNLLIDKKYLKMETPPRMRIGNFYTFKENNNLFGQGQQAVHNSGSSMMLDTPNFKESVLEFLKNHIDFKPEKINAIHRKGLNAFFDEQHDSLERFKKERSYRDIVLNDIFVFPFVFSKKISIDYLVISLMLFFIEKYNCFNSNHSSHDITKNAFKKHFKDEKNLLDKINDLFHKDIDLGYLLDVCFGRYYFLEIHFEFRNSSGKIRNTPLQIFQEFLEIAYQVTDVNDTMADEADEIKEQTKVNNSQGYTSEIDIDRANNRTPEQDSSSPLKRYKTDARLAKTAIKSVSYQCEYDISHNTFENNSGDIYMEAHHLIPMAKQSDFLPVNIDRTENIVSLCPNCHKAIHYGSIDEKKKRLEVLFSKRVKRLNKAKIIIDLPMLLSFYGI